MGAGSYYDKPTEVFARTVEASVSGSRGSGYPPLDAADKLATLRSAKAAEPK